MGKKARADEAAEVKAKDSAEAAGWGWAAVAD